jgi:DNA-binding CsgD family transcriptional regulator
VSTRARRTGTDLVAARRLLAEVRQLERELIEIECLRRRDALERVREAVERIGEVGTPDAILERAPEELGRGGPFAIVLVSELRDGVLVAQSLWLRDEPGRSAAVLGQLRRTGVRLEYPLAEAEAARSRVALRAAVAERGHRPEPTLTGVLGWESYVVAPLTLEGRTVGLLHAANAPGEPAVDALAEDLALVYADGLARAFERAALRQILQRHRDELYSAVQWMSARLDRLAGDRPGLQPAVARRQSLGVDVDALTQRETEVLELLARGRTNMQIAQTLVISEGTVKYHVKNVLRKLGAASRAEAVARYLQA